MSYYAGNYDEGRFAAILSGKKHQFKQVLTMPCHAFVALAFYTRLYDNEHRQEAAENMDTADEPPGSQEFRREERHPVGVPGRYRRGAGIPSDVQLLDLSKSGCRFFDKFGSLKPGTELTIRIGTMGPIVAKVRWRASSYVGVSFEPPLHDAILDHIRLNFPA